MHHLANVQNVLFDLDGTLVDASGTIIDSVRQALDVLDIDPASGPDIETQIGVPLLDIFVGGFGMTEERAHEAIDIYRDHYESLNQAGTTVYDGVREGLSSLRRKGFGLFIATVKPTAIAEKVLADLGLREHFNGVAGASMGPERRGKTIVITYALDKFGLDPDGCLMVGDRDQDIVGARANGMRSLAVTYGFGSRDELTGAGPDHLADEFADIPRLLPASG